MPLQPAVEWTPHIEEMLASPGTIVIVGAVDVGKTSFCTVLANASFEAGISTAIVDADTGQSEIGPPTTIGVSVLESPVHSPGDLRPRGLYFVGSTSPVGHVTAAVAGVRMLADRARELGADQVIVDTTGLVKGLVARQLKTHKLEILHPRHVVALQRSSECEHFLRLFDVMAGCEVHRLDVSSDAHPKSQMLRAQRRAVRLAEYFREARTVEFSLDAVATSGTYLRTGIPMEPKFLKFASTVLRAEAPHGEFIGGTSERPIGVYIVAPSGYDARGLEDLKQHFATSAIVVIPAIRYVNLAVGLIDDRLQTLAVGVIRKLDFRTRVASILTPLRSVHLVKAIRFGVLKLRPDGTEIARLRPGEV